MCWPEGAIKLQSGGCESERQGTCVPRFCPFAIRSSAARKRALRPPVPVRGEMTQQRFARICPWTRRSRKPALSRHGMPGRNTCQCRSILKIVEDFRIFRYFRPPLPDPLSRPVPTCDMPGAGGSPGGCGRKDLTARVYEGRWDRSRVPAARLRKSVVCQRPAGLAGCPGGGGVPGFAKVAAGSGSRG